jgi:hypothetical protein
MIILIHSGDKNKWIWDDWYHYFKKYMNPPKNTRVIFLSEFESTTWEGIESRTTGALRWSLGVKNLLKEFGDQPVLYLLEDYFMTATPNWNKILDIEKIMIEDNLNLMKIYIAKEIDQIKTHSKLYKPDIYEYDYTNSYSSSLQPSLWKASFLEAHLDPEETSWQFEIRGSNRIKDKRLITHFYHGPEIFPYIEILKVGKLRDYEPYYDKDPKDYIDKTKDM